MIYHCVLPLCSTTVLYHCVYTRCDIPLCSTTVSYRAVFYHCVIPLCYTTVLYHCVIPLCYTTVIYHCVLPLCSTTVLYHCVLPLCYTTVLYHCVIQPELTPLFVRYCFSRVLDEGQRIHMVYQGMQDLLLQQTEQLMASTSKQLHKIAVRYHTTWQQSLIYTLSNQLIIETLRTLTTTRLSLSLTPSGHLLRPDTASLSTFDLECPATLTCQISHSSNTNSVNSQTTTDANQELDISGTKPPPAARSPGVRLPSSPLPRPFPTLLTRPVQTDSKS